MRDTADDNSKKVRMILWRTPSLDFGLDSPAKAGLIPAQRLEDLLANIRVRDALNSKRALYTALEELQSTSSGKPWFSGAANQGYTGLYGFGATQVLCFSCPITMPLLTMLQELDVDELIANREEMHTRLGSMTRAIQSRNFAGMPAGASFDALLPSIDDSEHQEFLVTDGSKVSRGLLARLIASYQMCRVFSKLHTWLARTICGASSERFRLIRTLRLVLLRRLRV